MSEYDDIEKDRKDRRHEEPATPEAEVHAARWSPWIWVIPAVAIFFVGYLIVRYGFFGGGDITVRFVEARGLDRYSPVRFRGAKVGTVQKITIDEDLGHVVVRISMDASMNHALKKGTRFWVVEPGLEGGVGSILSGTYVGIAPGEGEESREFVGQEYAPVVSPPQAGKTIILEGRNLGTISIGSPVLLEGMRVGNVLGTEYDERRGVTSVHVFVVQRFAHQVRQSTRFYRAGGLSLSLGGGGISMGGAGLSSLLSTPPISFYTPEIMSGEPVPNGTRFELHESHAAAIAAADGPHLTYLTYFPGPIQGLTVGTPVRMKGVEVGHVREVRLRYVPETASLETPVMIEIDPRKLEFPVDASTSRDQLRADMNGAMQKMVNKGMRATLATSLVLPGASGIGLDFVAEPGTGRLVMTSEPPIIPAGTVGNGIEGALSAITDVANTIRGLPIREIAADLRSTSQRLNALVSDPRLEASLQKLDRSLTEIERAATITRENVGPIAESLRNAANDVESAAGTANQNIEPLVQSLRNAAASAEGAAKRAESLLGTSPKQNYDIAELIRELTRAAEAVRALAAYITENPDSLIKGRRE